MSVKQIAKVWEWSKADGGALLLMLAMADFCDDDGYCYPGVERLAKKCRCSERTIQRLILDQIKYGEIERTLNKGLFVAGERGPGHTNQYRILVGIKGGDNHVAANKKGGDKSGIKGVTNQVEGGAIAVAPNPSVEPSVEPSGRDDSNWLSKLRSIAIYQSLPFDTELGKAQAWCLANHRQCTMRFFTNWLNRALEDKPPNGTNPNRRPSCSRNAGTANDSPEVSAQFSDD